MTRAAHHAVGVGGGDEAMDGPGTIRHGDGVDGVTRRDGGGVGLGQQGGVGRSNLDLGPNTANPAPAVMVVELAWGRRKEEGEQGWARRVSKEGEHSGI